MKIKNLKIPAIIIAIGLIAAVAANMFTGIIKTPVITEHDFNYSATYKLDGQTKNIDGVYQVLFRSTGKGSEPLERYYVGHHLNNSDSEHPGAYTIVQKDDLELRLVFCFTDGYLMGDDKKQAEYAAALAVPYLAVYDEDEIEYVDEETLGMFDVELLSWEIPQPIENTFVFSGFSKLHDDSMAAMLIVGLLVIVAILIFVKRDKNVPCKALDKVSAVLNCVIGLVAIPFITIVVWLMQITVSSDAFIYQMYLCVPAFIAFTIAASIGLRRKGFPKTGFFVQFVGPILLAVLLTLE